MTVSIIDHLGPDDVRNALCADVREGFSQRPKMLPPKWFYDAAGSALFDKITRLVEYYPTEAERSALSFAVGEVVRLCGADTLVELGSGSSDKTRVLLDALTASGDVGRYVPFDVSAAALRDAAQVLERRYPELAIDCVVGDFDRHLAMLPGGGRRMVAFLGGTIGNYPPEPRRRLLASIAGMLQPGETLLLGTDLVKDPLRLVAAYDDESGVTASFNRNVLSVVNRELGADFDLDRFDHVARWNEAQERIEMWLRSTVRQTVTVAELAMLVDLDEGEEILTEISAKFRRDGVERELAAAGFEMIGWWTDPAGDFALSLSRRVE